MAKGKGKGKEGAGKGGKGGGGGGRRGKGGTAPEVLPQGQRPGLVDRMTVLVAIAFAASLAWQHLPL